MGPLRHQPAVVEHQYPVRARDGGNPFRHHDHDGVGQGVREGVPEPVLRAEIERGKAVIKKVDRRPPHQGARDADTLALAAGEVCSALADFSGHPEGQIADEPCGLGRFQRLP